MRLFFAISLLILSNSNLNLALEAGSESILGLGQDQQQNQQQQQQQQHRRQQQQQQQQQQQAQQQQEQQQDQSARSQQVAGQQQLIRSVNPTARRMPFEELGSPIRLQANQGQLQYQFENPPAPIQRLVQLLRQSRFNSNLRPQSGQSDERPMFSRPTIGHLSEGDDLGGAAGLSAASHLEQIILGSQLVNKRSDMIDNYHEQPGGGGRSGGRSGGPPTGANDYLNINDNNTNGRDEAIKWFLAELAALDIRSSKMNNLANSNQRLTSNNHDNSNLGDSLLAQLTQGSSTNGDDQSGQDGTMVPLIGGLDSALLLAPSGRLGRAVELRGGPLSASATNGTPKRTTNGHLPCFFNAITCF